MTHVHITAITFLAFAFGVQPLAAQEMSRYRDYVLASSLASVIATSGVRESGVRTTHERPARIQELEWRAPYMSSSGAAADPVRDVQFRFYDDQLYQVIVSYDRDRMEGLTNNDVIELLSATYGTPLLLNARRAGAVPPLDEGARVTVVARWEDTDSLLQLTRDPYAPQLKLVLLSKALAARADVAMKEALRLDVHEAPQRELDRREKAEADARVADEKARVVNKAAFRP